MLKYVFIKRRYEGNCGAWFNLYNFDSVQTHNGALTLRNPEFWLLQLISLTSPVFMNIFKQTWDC